jgi:hypothetical protein
LKLEGVVAAKLAGKSVAASGDEAEASVVGGFAEDDDEGSGELAAGALAGADEGGAETAVLKCRQDGNGGEAETGGDNAAIDFDRRRAEEDMGGDLAALLGDERNGILAALDKQPDEAGFEVSRERGSVHGLDGGKVARERRANEGHVKTRKLNSRRDLQLHKWQATSESQRNGSKEVMRGGQVHFSIVQRPGLGLAIPRWTDTLLGLSYRSVFVGIVSEKRNSVRRFVAPAPAVLAEKMRTHHTMPEEAARRNHGQQ